MQRVGRAVWAQNVANTCKAILLNGTFYLSARTGTLGVAAPHPSAFTFPITCSRATFCYASDTVFKSRWEIVTEAELEEGRVILTRGELGEGTVRGINRRLNKSQSKLDSRGRPFCLAVVYNN